MSGSQHPLLRCCDLFRGRAGGGARGTSHLVAGCTLPPREVITGSERLSSKISALSTRTGPGSLRVCIHTKECHTVCPVGYGEGLQDPLKTDLSSSLTRITISSTVLPAMTPSELELARQFKMHVSGGCWSLTAAVYLELPLGVFSWQIFVERLAITQLRSMIRGL